MLPPWVSHCVIEDKVIFLDVRQNRYLALSHSGAAGLLNGTMAGLSAGVAKQVNKLGWLEGGEDRCSGGRPPIAALGELSSGQPPSEVPFETIVSAARFVAELRLAMTFRKFERLLQGVAIENRAAASTDISFGLNQLVAAFQIVEQFLLPHGTCLLRSLALHRLLSRKGHPSTLLFGVKLHPFEAHCWLQNDDILINDTFEQVGLFMPLRAVH